MQSRPGNSSYDIRTNRIGYCFSIGPFCCMGNSLSSISALPRLRALEKTLQRRHNTGSSSLPFISLLLDWRGAWRQGLLPLSGEVFAFYWAATARLKLGSPLRVWSNKKLTESTKIQVYGACVLSTVLCGNESWTLHPRQEKQLNTFHMRGIQRILNITWQGNVPNYTVLKRPEIPKLYTHWDRDVCAGLAMFWEWMTNAQGNAPLAGPNYALKISARGTWRPWALTSTFRLEASSAVRPLGVRRDKQAKTKRQTRKARIQGDRPATDQICSLWRKGLAFLNGLSSHTRRCSGTTSQSETP